MSSAGIAQKAEMHRRTDFSLHILCALWGGHVFVRIVLVCMYCMHGFSGAFRTREALAKQYVISALDPSADKGSASEGHTISKGSK